MAQEFWIFLISGLALLIFALAWLVIMLISKFLTKIVYSYPSQNHTDTAIQCTISLRYVLRSKIINAAKRKCAP